MQRSDADVLIVGAGLAGLAAALSVTDRRVTILCPALPPEATASSCAQGGIAAAVGQGDSPALHALDTLQAGVGLCDAGTVRLLCEAAPAAIHWLENLGVPFDRERDAFALHREGGHQRARVLHIDGDRSGQALTTRLFEAARAAPNIEFRAGHTAVSLLRGDADINGVMVCDELARPLAIHALDTVIATGGLGQLFEHTTNPRSACGDGLAMAMIAGARSAGLEFVQFHPTAFAASQDPLPLISEAVRGAGATLIDEHCARFMMSIHPDAELASRDVVARAVWRRVQAGHRVYLDARQVLQADAACFPALRSLCASHRIDPLRELIPILPAAHYHMGGIAVNADGCASVAHLWACGEVACTGAHGANRLASNSLLEAVVCGRRLGAALTARRRHLPLVHRSRVHRPRVVGIAEPTLEVDARIWAAVRGLMWNALGIERNAAALMAGREQLALLLRQAPLRQVLLRGRIRLGIAMFSAALARSGSIGAHCRTDQAVLARAATEAINELASETP